MTTAKQFVTVCLVCVGMAALTASAQAQTSLSAKEVLVLRSALNSLTETSSSDFFAAPAVLDRHLVDQEMATNSYRAASMAVAAATWQASQAWSPSPDLSSVRMERRPKSESWYKARVVTGIRMEWIT